MNPILTLSDGREQGLNGFPMECYKTFSNKFVPQIDDLLYIISKEVFDHYHLTKLYCSYAKIRRDNSLCFHLLRYAFD